MSDPERQHAGQQDRTLILAIGNRDRGDDGLGPAAAAALRSMRSQYHATATATQTGEAPSFDICEGSGEPTQMWDLWSGYSRVVVIDALQSSRRPPGTILRLSSDQIATATEVRPFSTHGMGLTEAIQLGNALGYLPPSLWVVGAVGADFSPLAPLSHAVAQALPEVINEALRALTAGSCSAHTSSRTLEGGAPHA